MDNLLKQMRVKFSGLVESQEDSYNTQEGRIPPQKTVSFKKERKKATPWFQRQLSDQKSEDYDSADLELGAAIAAVAYAIMLAEEGLLDEKKPIDELGSSLSKAKSKRDDSMNKPKDSSKFSRWLSAKAEFDDDDDDDGRVVGDSFKRKSSTLEERMQEETAADLKTKEKAMSSTPSIKKTPTFSDKYLNGTGKRPFESGQEMRTRTNAAPTIKPMPSLSSNGFDVWNRTQSTNGLKKAYDWEQATMEKIRKRHEKMSNTILHWENEKKVKAKRRMERKERELEMRRARILQEFREEMIRIDMIASGARVVADDARRSDELKAKLKAKKLSIKKVHRKCFCF